MDKEKCQLCGKELKPDKESKAFESEYWDGYTYFPCSCIGGLSSKVRIVYG